MYVVLAETAEGDWTIVGEFTATDVRSAIRQASKESTDGGRFVAVPKRSWQPLTVRVETRQVVLWDDAPEESFPAPGGEHSAVPSPY